MSQIGDMCQACPHLDLPMFPVQVQSPVIYLHCWFCVVASVIEWSGYTLIPGRAGSFTVLEHKTIRLCLLSNMLHIYLSSSFTIINVHTVYIYNYSFKVTSNKIHTYNSMHIGIVHSDVHLVLQFQVLLIPLFPFPVYSSLTNAWSRCQVPLSILGANNSTQAFDIYALSINNKNKNKRIKMSFMYHPRTQYEWNK